MDSAIWCRTPAAASAAKRLRPEVWKNPNTALSSNEGELARSITTCAPAMASLRPSPVMLLTPLLGEPATTSWPPWRRMATVFEPIRPVPPMTTIFMVYPRLSTTQMGSNAWPNVADRQRCNPGAKSSVASRTNVNHSALLNSPEAGYAVEVSVISPCDTDGCVAEAVGLVQLKSA